MSDTNEEAARIMAFAEAYQGSDWHATGYIEFFCYTDTGEKLWSIHLIKRKSYKETLARLLIREENGELQARPVVLRKWNDAQHYRKYYQKKEA